MLSSSSRNGFSARGAEAPVQTSQQSMEVLRQSIHSDRQSRPQGGTRALRAVRRGKRARGWPAGAGCGGVPDAGPATAGRRGDGPGPPPRPCAGAGASRSGSRAWRPNRHTVKIGVLKKRRLRKDLRSSVSTRETALCRAVREGEPHGGRVERRGSRSGRGRSCRRRAPRRSRGVATVAGSMPISAAWTVSRATGSPRAEDQVRDARAARLGPVRLRGRRCRPSARARAGARRSGRRARRRARGGTRGASCRCSPTGS